MGTEARELQSTHTRTGLHDGIAQHAELVPLIWRDVSQQHLAEGELVLGGVAADHRDVDADVLGRLASISLLHALEGVQAEAA